MTGSLRRWWRNTRLYHRIQRRRADRQMPAVLGHWPPGGPITVWLHPHVAPQNAAGLRRAAGWWQRAVGREVFYVTWMTAEDATRYLVYDVGAFPPRSIVVTSDVPVLDAGATHVLQRRPNTGELTHGEIRLGPTAPWRELLHELGHGLGLGDNHGADPSLLMTPDRTAKGCALLEDELAWLQAQWPPTTA